MVFVIGQNKGFRVYASQSERRCPVDRSTLFVEACCSVTKQQQSQALSSHSGTGWMCIIIIVIEPRS